MDILRFKEFIELSEGSNKVNPLKDIKKLIRNIKGNRKLGQNNPPESLSVIIPEPSLNTGEKSNLIVFDA